MKARTDTAPLLWLGLVLFIALAIAFLLPVTPQDYWWYLRIGRDTLTSGAIPRVDTFTSTQAGSPVVYFSWGAAVLFWLLYKLGGLTLTVLVRGILVGLAYSLVWLTARRAGAGRISAALVTLLAILASSNNWSLRPQLFAYPLFALSLFILFKWQNGDRKADFWLPLLCLLWVNMHGSFVMLILLTGAALVFGRGDKAPLGLATAGVLLATFLNPRGPGAWTYVYQSLTVASNQFSTEWSPPEITGWQMSIFFVWTLAFPLLAVFSPRKPDLLEWCLFLGFGVLALSGERYVIWFVLILAVLTSRLLAEWEKKYIRDPKPGSPVLNVIVFLVLILLPLVMLPGVRAAWWTKAPAATENTPISATTWLATQPDVPGPLWSEIGFSSYLEFALPERPVWIDTRFEVFPVEQWQRYQEISGASPGWQTLLADTHSNLLMISVLEQPDLLQALRGEPAWCEIHHDEQAVIYQRRINDACGAN